MITARAAATFEPVGRSVATARSFVRDTLQGWGFADIVDDAVVLTSELVTNAVVHAGTHADVLCLRTGDGVRIEVSDRYPEREIPLQAAAISMGSPDREGGRGLQLCAALAGRWGVEYTPTHKNVWFQLDLPERPVGTRTAGPALPAELLPLADGRIRVAVVQIDRAGTISAWNEDAEDLFGYAADQVTGKPLTDLAAWPHTAGTGTGIAEALRLSRWEGSYGIRDTSGRVVPVYASHLRVRDAAGEPSTVCLLVRDHERAVLQTPQRTPPPPIPAATATGRAPTRSRHSSARPHRTTSTACSSAPWNAPATCSTATPPSSSSPPTTRRNWRSAPPPACPPPGSASPASPSRPAPAATARPACPPSTRTSRPSPAPYPC
ncbi:hypothetical protein GCM10020256_18610 [Streptomyces thermocoprophilus]